MKKQHRIRRLPPWMSGAAMVLVAGFAAGMIPGAGRVAPAVGDIIVFRTNDASFREPDARIAVHRPNQYGCILNLNTLHRTGGSLIVEAQLADPAPAFRLHWAGERTSTDSGDCGHSADVIVDPVDLRNLANAAGGRGARRIPAVIPYGAN
jgi:hypothetical protein